MQSQEIRKKFLDFFEKKGHKIVPSSSLVPENDPSVLFTTAGMQPMVAYLLGQEHPKGKRIANSQKCFRANDIEEVGDNRHTTFFEMLGNWSLGDYFKREQIPWIFEFLTKEIKLDPKKIYVTAFIGDPAHNLPKDFESAEIWKNLFAEKGITAKEVEFGTEKRASEIGMGGGRIFYYQDKNWWSMSGNPDSMQSGEPGGPDSEMFYEFSDIQHDVSFGKYCHPNCDCGRYVEIGNSVFMEYQKKSDGSFAKLPKQNVDFGGGLERLIAASNNEPDVFKIDTLFPIIKEIERLSEKKYGEDFEITKSFRIISDHIRAAVFMIADGVTPSNTERGYILRRLVRRAVVHAHKLNMNDGAFAELAVVVVQTYKNVYSIDNKIIDIKNILITEIEKFKNTLDKGLKEFEKGIDPFVLLTTYGFPIELTLELAKEKDIVVDVKNFEEKFKKHQEISRVGSEHKFKGGLADHNPKTIKLHTAHHLLLAALQEVLGKNVKQRGSNITQERLRLDFSFDRKLTDEEKKRVEEIVNDKIKESLPVVCKELPKAEAEKLGAEMEFGAKYGDVVSVYLIGEENKWISREFCGGPHVGNTNELGEFKITKEEAVAAGIRRIKGVLE
ncbi:hypothetical protein A2645_00320 [Candidatus Nomurabacteria bacterium RIFCSPHIGHO2_01_FULL_39_9]|uniref:alanine--tRNA ligase n=1 Tax=Candidatus Nomurabacteria bacterium RIFCSPHIGHO2_01_FULL_39_9 TaxID=1801735 RepID=A0A1F6UVM9_9BACT|nr:MAG: hypothetical protein A2645_00320 [Candidatus Nomurabacteria bacterium RIFCSPHIGHO2_01_FULL_39_9]